MKHLLQRSRQLVKRNSPPLLTSAGSCTTYDGQTFLLFFVSVNLIPPPLAQITGPMEYGASFNTFFPLTSYMKSLAPVVEGIDCVVMMRKTT
uniref:Uncharacterized protein n=1 Tax=Helianthus annuus TaxID=4232 RepID=A0A1Y3BXD9_HELAN